MNQNNAMTQNNIIARHKLQQSEHLLKQATELLHQIEQKCTTTKKHYIFKSYDTLTKQFVPYYTIQDLKRQGLPKHQMRYEENGYSVQVLERYYLDLETMFEYYNEQCKIEALYATHVQNIPTLEEYKNKEYKTLHDITYLLQLYKNHHTTIQEQFNNNVTWAKESADVLLSNTTALQEYLVTFSQNMMDDNIKDLIFDKTQYDIRSIPYIRLPEEVHNFEPDGDGTVGEIFENMSYLCHQNDAYFTYICDMKHNFIFMESNMNTCVYNYIKVNQDPGQETNHNDPDKKNIVKTRQIQIGNAIINKGLSDWARRLAPSYATSYCEGTDGQEMFTSFSTISDMYESNKELKYCLDDDSMVEDDTMEGVDHAIRVYQIAGKLNNGLRNICIDLNIRSFITDI